MHEFGLQVQYVLHMRVALQDPNTCHSQATVSFVRSFVCIGLSRPLTARVDAK
jgi:hypothetical protein